MATTFSQAVVGLIALLWTFSAAISANAQFDRETRYGAAQQPDAESRSWSNDNFYDGQQFRDAVARPPRADSSDRESAGQYQRGKSIGINIVDAGQGKVTITYIHPDSPAELAGLQQGDAIRRVDGRRVTSTLDVIEHINRVRAHDRVNVEVERAQRMRSFQVRLAPQQDVMVRGRGDGPEVQFSSQQNSEDANTAYAYQAQYGERSAPGDYSDAVASPSTYISPTQRTYGQEQAAYSSVSDSNVPSNRMLIEQIGQLRRELREVRQELAELRQQVDRQSRDERRAQDLQLEEIPSRTQDYQPRTQDYQYDGF